MFAYFFTNHSSWAWLIVAMLLAGLEMVVPGVFLIWIAIAAFLTGVLNSFLDFSWQISFLIFSALSIISVFGGRYFDNKRKNNDVEFKSLNQRAERLIGQTFQLTESIENGNGRIRVNDSSWRVESKQSLVSGAYVRVTGITEDGTVLIVESM